MKFSFATTALSLGLAMGTAVPACTRDDKGTVDTQLTATSARTAWTQPCYNIPTLTMSGVHVAGAARTCIPAEAPLQTAALIP